MMNAGVNCNSSASKIVNFECIGRFEGRESV